MERSPPFFRTMYPNKNHVTTHPESFSVSFFHVSLGLPPSINQFIGSNNWIACRQVTQRSTSRFYTTIIMHTLQVNNIGQLLRFGKCSKILNTSCLPKWPRQTGQTQIRLLLNWQSDQHLHCLLFGQAFCEFQH